MSSYSTPKPRDRMAHRAISRMAPAGRRWAQITAQRDAALTQRLLMVKGKIRQPAGAALRALLEIHP